MKSLLFFLFCFPICVISQTLQHPVLQSQAKETKSFIPLGWAILDSAFNDLNNDNLTDLVMVIQEMEQTNWKRFQRKLGIGSVACFKIH